MADIEDTNNGEGQFPLPDGYTLLDWAASLKCLNADGDVVLLSATSENLTTWEALGMCNALYLDAQTRMNSSYEYEDDE
jgi:hypothetical protein